MTFSVGVLYSAREFAAYIAENEISLDDFKTAFKKFSLARSDDILQISLKCKWIDLHVDGTCRITPQGKLLLEQSSLENALRIQICDLIHALEPVWATQIPDGRQEAISGFPEDVIQCFKEAGLLQKWTDDLIEWWDKLAIATRIHKSEKLLSTGREAERLTIQYEMKRTGAKPVWKSLDTNYAGYDILSQASSTDTSPRKIEVKGTIISLKEAYFTLSRHEWRTAEKSEDYRIHLWCLKGEPQLIDIGIDALAKHIPKNQGEGNWETVRIRFKSFYN